MVTWSNIEETERLADFSKYFESKKDEIRLRNPKFKKPRKRCPDIGSKNIHINFQADRGTMGTLSKIGELKG